MADPDAFSADIGRYFGPTSESPVARIRDVVICTTGGSGGLEGEFLEHPPVGSPLKARLEGSADPVNLGRGLRLDRLPGNEAELVMTACTPRGHHFVPIKQFGQRFTFVRELHLSEWDRHPYDWDREGVMTDALMLSRLVRDNAYSTEFAARIIDFQDGVQIVAYALSTELDHVYRVRHTRDWLDYGEAAELRDLLAAYWSIPDMPPRVRRALWRTEYASWIKWADLILPILVSGLEALVKTERHRATRQFKVRVAALAEALGLDGVTEEFCEEIYEARSDWVHGNRVELFAGGSHAGEGGPVNNEQRDAMASVARLQDVLRTAARRAIEDPAFREIFRDDEVIGARWPI
ncbi:MAG: hypothetical protein ACXVUE_05915 [Solirubrobacteraceae bacterium]